MRIATYNVEWCNALFDDEGALMDDGGWSGRHDVTRADQLAALGIVFNALDADAVLVVEAPDESRKRQTVPALERFADVMGLRARKALLGFANDTQQELALLYDPRVLTCRHDPKGEPTGQKGSRDTPRFDGVFRIDLDIDATEDKVVFSKPPIEIAVETRSGTALRIIGAHLKSKAPHGARGRDEAMRMGIANRRKHCIALPSENTRPALPALPALPAGRPVMGRYSFASGDACKRSQTLFWRCRGPQARRAPTRRPRGAWPIATSHRACLGRPRVA